MYSVHACCRVFLFFNVLIFSYSLYSHMTKDRRVQYMAVAVGCFKLLFVRAMLVIYIMGRLPLHSIVRSLISVGFIYPIK